VRKDYQHCKNKPQRVEVIRMVGFGAYLLSNALTTYRGGHLHIPILLAEFTDKQRLNLWGSVAIEVCILDWNVDNLTPDIGSNVA
jgi:hypothetical protein